MIAGNLHHLEKAVLVRIPEVLSTAEVEAVQSLLVSAPFVDGKLSAGMAARAVKSNQEVDVSAGPVEALNNIVMAALVRHPEYASAALPQRVAVPYYARYRKGMAYGDHVDDAVMGPVGSRYRSDVSITVFLNDPADYAGGELVICGASGDQSFKLAAGDAVLYPSSSLHHVNEVTDGERLVAVTWVQSMVRDAEQRRLLLELNRARESLLQSDPGSATTAQVNLAYSNLFRMWAEL